MRKKTRQVAPKISIIVPVYNVQAYLEKCLSSLLAQTFEDIEIICVNDGSTDDSLTILQDFAAQDKRIKIIDRPNGGVSAARNDGLEKATGEYVMFVDGDDWIEPETCAECYKKITNDRSDMLVFNFRDVFSDDKVKIHDKLQAVPDDNPFFFSECPDDFFYTITSVWGKLFKRRPNIKFATDLKKGEDAVYYWEYCLRFNPQISVLNKAFYNYLKRDNSAMKSAEFMNDCEILKSVKTLVAKDCFQKAEKRIQSRILDRFALSLCREVKCVSLSNNFNYFDQIQKFINMFSDYSDLDGLRYYSQLLNLVDTYRLKIDLVYLWVDGNDIEWKKQKNEWAERCGLPVDDIDNAECRYIDNEELRYSLRSVAKNAPWINKIFIVTNVQVPQWLNTSHPKIEIITHEQIMPKDALPTFNSEAIEACIANIPGLSEYFLYANDDFFIGKPVQSNFFYDNDGKPKYYMTIQNWTPEQIKTMHFRNTVTTAINLMRDKKGRDFSNYSISHNIVPHRKSYYQACAKEFKKEFDYVTHCQFRTENTVQRIITEFYTMTALDITPTVVEIHAKRKPTPLAYVDLETINQMLCRLKVNSPTLFCINDNEKTLEQNRSCLKSFLAALFPIKQKWEKNYGTDGSLLDDQILVNILQTKCTSKKHKKIKWFDNKYVWSFFNIPFLKIRNNPNSFRVYLLKIIPLYKITHRKQYTIFKLFNFLPLFKSQKQ